MMMYRTHCQRILDTVIRANFDEVYPPPFPFFYTLLIVQKYFCKIKNKTKQTKRLIKTIIQSVDEIFVHVNFMNSYFSGTEFLATLLAGDAGTHDGDSGLADDSSVGGSVRHNAVQGHC